MDNQIVIHATDKQKRIALIEKGELAQFFIESPENRRSVGDIYLAQVHKVMGGIRAAFIDLSTPKDAFLHYSDLGEHLEEYLIMLNSRDDVPKKASTDLHDFRKKISDNETGNMSSKEQSIQEQNLLGCLLKPGQKIMVQIVKEPIGSKGPRVSTDITLAGRFLVLIPFGDYVAVSKRIRSYKERRRLRGVINSMLPNGFGVIVRTVAESQNDEALLEDLKDLHDKWIKITEKLQSSKPTALLHRDLDMTESLVRDLFSKNYNRILIDNPESFKAIRNYISRIAPAMVGNVVQHKGREHIFDHVRISRDIESIFSPRVRMPSGGYLIFEQTEAMYVVDVNSGRYAAKKEQEDNSLRTNLEAAREIAKQLRLRDIGGIIVVDFIDLQDDSNRKKIYDELKKEFKKDRAKTNILPMSDFGLMQITRQRIRPSVVKSVSKVCPMCGGSGSIVSENTLHSDIFSWLHKFRFEHKYRSVDVYVNPHFHSILCQGLFSQRLRWMLKFKMYINIIPDETVSLNDFKATLRNSEIDISTAVLEGKSISETIAETEKMIAEMESEGKKDKDYLDIYKKETRSRGSRQTEKDNQYNKNNQTDNRNEQDEKQKKSNVRINTAARNRDKVKSKYFKSTAKNEPQNGNGGKSDDDTTGKPDALEVAKAYAKKVEQKKETAVSESAAKKAESKAMDVKKENNQSESAESNVADQKKKTDSRTRKVTKAPVKVKKTPKKKGVKNLSNDNDAAPKPELEKPSTETDNKTADKKNSPANSNRAEADKVMASLSEDQFRKPAHAPVTDGGKNTIKKTTVKKRAIAKKAALPKESQDKIDTPE
jgi:ribonuclease G